MKRLNDMRLPILLCAAILVCMALLLSHVPAPAAESVSGALTAKASGALTAKTFVKITAGGDIPTVATATAVTDAIIGICEQTAATGVITRYAPPGTITEVTSGAAIAVGDLLIPTTGGKAIPLPTTTSTTQRFGAFALEAATDADQDIRVYVVLGQVEQFDSTGDIAFTGDITVAANKGITAVAGTGIYDLSLATGIFKSSTGANTLSGDVTISGSKTFTTGTGTVTLNGTVALAANKNAACAAGTTAIDWSLGTGVFKTTTGAVTIGGDTTISGSKTFATGTGAVGLNGDVTVAAGKDISFAAGAGYLELNGATTGSIKVKPIDGGTSATTLQNSAAAAATTVTLPAVTGQLGWTPGGGTTSIADSLAIPITHAYVAKTTGGDAEALTIANGKPGQIITITLIVDGGGDGTLTPATSTSVATIVFADAGDTATLLYVDDTVGWVVVGLSGLSAPPAYTLPA